MKTAKLTVTVLFLATALQCVGATPEGNARYDIILSRQPFGSTPPPPPKPAAPAPIQPQPTAAELSFARTLRVAYMRRSEPDELRVGIIDSKTKKSYVLQEGETDEDGLELRQVDFDKGSALVARGDVETWITAGDPPKSKAPASSTPTTGRTPTSSSNRYQEILKRRQEEMRKRAELMRRQRSSR